MTNAMRRSLVGVVSGCVLVGLVVAALSVDTDRAGAARDGDDERREARLCLTVADGGTNLFTLTISHRSMFDPDPDDVAVVTGVINDVEPAHGAALRTGRQRAVVNLTGTVAGFFTGMQITWDTQRHSGTGRLLGELSAHRVTVTRVACR